MCLKDSRPWREVALRGRMIRDRTSPSHRPALAALPQRQRGPSEQPTPAAGWRAAFMTPVPLHDAGCALPKGAAAENDADRAFRCRDPGLTKHHRCHFSQEASKVRHGSAGASGEKAPVLQERLESVAWRLWPRPGYSVAASSADSSDVSAARVSALPISCPSIVLTGASRRRLEMSHTASASSRSAGVTGP